MSCIINLHVNESHVNVNEWHVQRVPELHVKDVNESHVNES